MNSYENSFLNIISCPVKETSNRSLYFEFMAGDSIPKTAIGSYLKKKTNIHSRTVVTACHLV